MLEGEYHSAVDMQAVLPGFSPVPIGWGVFSSDENLLQAFHDMDTEIPDMDLLTKMLAEFHLKSAERFEELTQGRRPADMRFEYHVTTCNGKLTQDNTWTRTWQEYFVRSMRRMLEHDEKEGGERPQEIEDLLPPLFEKVIPRLLRPMEIDGREVKPSLIHGDLWYGNTSTDHDNNAPIVYDACCFWGHNECKWV
jgi:protein-ribulosamine 3-kinase